MRRRDMLVVLTSTLTLTAAAVALAGSPTKAAKKTFTGIVESVDVKQQMITVKMPEASQQIQTQSGPAKAATRLVFRIDTHTTVTAKAAKANKTQGPAGPQPSKISLLRAGQLVRVVYGEVSLAISVEILCATGKPQAGGQAGTSAVPPVLQPAAAPVAPAGSSNPVPPAPPAAPAAGSR